MQVAGSNASPLKEPRTDIPVNKSQDVFDPLCPAQSLKVILFQATHPFMIHLCIIRRMSLLASTWGMCESTLPALTQQWDDCIPHPWGSV